MENLVNKLITLDRTINSELVHKRVVEVEKIIDKISKKDVISTMPARLEIFPDEFEEISEGLTLSEVQDLNVLNKLLTNFRSYLSRKYGIWSLPNLAAAEMVKEEFNAKTALEVMAGNGYWSLALNKVGIKTKATDSLEWAKTSQTGSNRFYPVEKLTAEQAVKKYPDVDIILCAWAPNFGSEDYKLLQSYRKYYDLSTKLLFIGEKDGATNTPLFWQEAKLIDKKKIKKINQVFQSFDFIDERFYGIR
ncbi:SAM-dependent methyltransferase [Lactobacillus sp. PV012]|uniref:SAM-dependent methyltransferase n=1 Tax=Lactobacillus sp. PV012 TaxID=2594494 RepID=UPI002240B286|nr:SAM-dependent methyltransferase [Lactobacillus sp. PV012]QNQ82314.1 SAM-dependent methyltransferase [Lactobacillus sp. PV012]